MAHESIMSGYMGIQRTTDRIMESFYRPGIHGNVTRFCRSCDVCQKTEPKGKVSRATLEDMPVIDTPFKRIAVNIIGSISPILEKNRYILIVVDFTTRYQEAVALLSIETVHVAKALLEIYSQIGFVISIRGLSDMGIDFTSSLMREISRLISVRQLTTSPNTQFVMVFVKDITEH